MNEKLAPGDLFEPLAATWNNLIDAKDDFLRRKMSSPGTSSAIVTPSVEIKNETGDDLRKGAVVEFDGNALDDSQIKQDVFWLKGVTPNEKRAGFGITTEPIPVGKIGPCVTAGTCTALVRVTDTGHKYAKLVAGQTVLQSAESGPVRIDYAPGQGEVECIVTVAPSASSPTIYFTLTEPLLPGGEANAFQNTFSGGAWVPVGNRIRVVDSRSLWRGLLGYSGIAFRREDGKYEIIVMQRNDLIVAFEVNVDRDPSLPLMVCKLTYSFQHGNVQPPNPVAGFITVHDPMFLFKYALEGARGYAIYNDRLDRYEAIACQQRCMYATAFINNPQGSGDPPSPPGGMGGNGYVPINGFAAASPAPFDLTPSTLPTQCLNIFGHMGRHNDEVLLAWIDDLEEWVVIDVERHKLKLIVADTMFVNAGEKALKAKVLESAMEVQFLPNEVSATKLLDLRTC